MIQDIETAVKSEIADILNLEVQDIELDMHLIEELDFDSNCMQELILAIEEKCCINLESAFFMDMCEEMNCFTVEDILSENEELIQLITVSDLIQFILKQEEQ